MDFNKAEIFVRNLLQTKLSPYLYYHSYEHTIDVTRQAEILAKEEKVSEKEVMLVKTAALFHDCGFINLYQNHEEESARIAREQLPLCGYTNEDIDVICQLILKTKFPAQPKTHLEKILCDADLDYLGRDDYEEISQKLLQEWTSRGKDYSTGEWHELQINFIQKHAYWTASAQAKRNVQKADNLMRLRSVVGL